MVFIGLVCAFLFVLRLLVVVCAFCVACVRWMLSRLFCSRCMRFGVVLYGVVLRLFRVFAVLVGGRVCMSLRSAFVWRMF